MNRRSILRTIPCDLKKLPIGAGEAFVLSQVHGRSTAEDVAEAAGLELVELLTVVRRLVHLGALSVDDEKPKPKTKRPSATMRATRSTAAPPPRRSERSLVPPALVPVVRKHPDLRSLGLGPREGFVLSQIDGVTSAADLGEITGLNARDLGEALRALESAGVVELGAGKRRASKASIKAPPRVSTPAPIAAPPAAVAPPAPERPSCELPEADRARITETSARLDGLDHYAVLGLERDVDGKAIRRAFHALAAQYHPDRFFGKRLGSYQQPLERIFVRLSRAYETLSKKGEREQYDAKLPPLPSKPAPSRKPPPKTPTRKSLRAVRAATVHPPRGSRRPSPPPKAPSASSADSRPDPLLRAYAEKKRRSVQDHVDVFVRAAKEALDRDDLVAAANNYRLAVQCSDDPELRVTLEAIDGKARARVREKSLTGARAAEQGGRWGEAGEKYAKAYGVHPEAWIAERAANALRQGGTDLRRAAQLAEAAVLAEPQNAGYRVTLGEIYFDAGLLARAAGESARATALAPSDVRAAVLAKKVAKGAKGKAE